jgi:hypothetical protein
LKKLNLTQAPKSCMDNPVNRYLNLNLLLATLLLRGVAVGF